MFWRILPILFALPIHFAFAGYNADEPNARRADVKAEPTWDDFVSGATWSVELSTGQRMSAEEAVYDSPFMTNLKIDEEEGRFFKIASGAQYLYLLGVTNKNEVTLYFGSPGNVTAFQFGHRFTKTYELLKQAGAYLEKAEGVRAFNGRALANAIFSKIAEAGAFSVGRVRLNSGLTVAQRAKFLKKIYELSKSCDLDLADWTGR